MPQLFHPSTNVISKLSIVAVVSAVPLVGVAGYFFNMTYGLEMRVPKEQPVEFSHKHHVGDDGIDCRYCHSSVDKSSSAGMPSTQTCMTCHSQLWKDSPMLAPVRESFRTGVSIQWTRVHDLPDFAYFDHSIHVNKGVGCETCHGRVDRMPLMWQEASLQMSWCLDCHRRPEAFLRPREHIYTMGYEPPANQLEFGRNLAIQYKIQDERTLTSCSTCHR
jgi:hypothetical protein